MIVIYVIFFNTPHTSTDTTRILSWKTLNRVNVQKNIVRFHFIILKVIDHMFRYFQDMLSYFKKTIKSRVGALMTGWIQCKVDILQERLRTLWYPFGETNGSVATQMLCCILWNIDIIIIIDSSQNACLNR